MRLLSTVVAAVRDGFRAAPWPGRSRSPISHLQSPGSRWPLRWDWGRATCVRFHPRTRPRCATLTPGSHPGRHPHSLCASPLRPCPRPHQCALWTALVQSRFDSILAAMSVPSSSAAVLGKSSSSHASTSIRSPMLSGTSGASSSGSSSHAGTAGNGGATAANAAAPSAPVSPAMHTRGSLHLPAQPTVAPITRRASAGPPAATSGAPSAAVASPVPSASPPPVPVHPSPSQAAADANRRSSGNVPPRSSPLPPPILSPPPSASPPPQLPQHPPASVPSTPTAAPVPNTDDWQLDSEATACHNCAIKFSILTRKHHWSAHWHTTSRSLSRG